MVGWEENRILMIKNKKILIQILIVFLFTLAVASLFLTLDADPHHDGIMLKPAVDVANGEILFKQMFTQYGALVTFLQALALGIFGKYLIVIRLLTAFFYAIIATVIWMIWSRLIPQWLASLTCIA
jgi:4-amino-4-deoxy-L-arabinose transferase-like glycosyltransferase